MDFRQVIADRHSIRRFTDDPVDEAQLQSILATVNHAPSAGNLQAFDVYVVRGRSGKAALTRGALDQAFIAQAPVVLVFCASPDRSAARYVTRGETLYCVQDATIACTYAMLAATDLGLASVWVGAFDEDTVRTAIGSPKGHRPVALLPIGHAAEPPRVTPRRALSEIVHEVV